MTLKVKRIPQREGRGGKESGMRKRQEDKNESKTMRLEKEDGPRRRDGVR